jgi:NAD(P)-dependent dehydrogenase (short-subunit alcohol dehydrogenase family)
MGNHDSFLSQNRLNSIVFGGGHGIGLALVHEILKRDPEGQLFVTYRNPEKAHRLFELQEKEPIRVVQCDPLDEKELSFLAKEIGAEINQLDLCINSIGILHDEEIEPEKSVKDLDLHSLIHSFTVNTCITALIAKYFKQSFSREDPSCFASLSAKIGSIEDNRLGGWYAYRMSKAALNMLIKTLSLEFEREKRKCSVLAIHPGTTQTEFSKPYSQNVSHKIWPADQTAIHILDVIETCITNQETGVFKNWDKNSLPW